MLADYRLLVDDLVRDDAGRLDQASRDRAIALAVTQYGKDRPRVAVADLVSLAPVSGGAAVTHLALPAGWVVGESIALSIEHPLGRMPIALIPRHCWDMIQIPTGQVIALPAQAPVDEAFRLSWSKPHEVGLAVDTIPTGDREAVAQYAASILLEQAASDLSGDRSSTIKADSVDHGDGARNFAARAKTARDRYHQLMGIDLGRRMPASAAVAIAPPTSNGRKRLFWRR